jgi:hypothetical protein
MLSPEVTAGDKILFSCSYIPVLMAQAKVYWDTENYPQVEQIFRKSVEFCSEHDTWKLNVAHVLFMQVQASLGPGTGCGHL